MLRHTEGPWIPSDDISRSSKSGLSSCSLHDLIALNPSVVDQITSFEVGDQQTARLQTPRRARHCRQWRLWHRRNSRSNDPIRSMCSFPLLFTAPPKEPRRATEKRRRLPERRAPHRRSTPVAYPFRGMPPNLFPGKRGAAAGLTRRAWRAAGPPRGCCSSSRAARSTRWGCVRWPSDPPGR